MVAAFGRDPKSFSLTNTLIRMRSMTAAAMLAPSDPDTDRHQISSLSGKLTEGFAEGTVATPYGKSRTITREYTDESSSLRLAVTLGTIPDRSMATVHAVCTNEGTSVVTLEKIVLCDTRPSGSGVVQLEGSRGEWLATPLIGSPRRHNPVNLHRLWHENYPDALGLYRSDGAGVVIGAIGPGTCYTEIEIFLNNTDVGFSATSLFGVQLGPGESRESETIAFISAPPTQAVELWAGWIADSLHARNDKGSAHGWCSWYDKTTQITEAHVKTVTQAVRDSEGRLVPQVIQIDDGYQRMDGDWTGNDTFPSGMAGLAKEIRTVGSTPGIWVAPLMIDGEHPWAVAHPECLQQNAEGIETLSNPNPFHPSGAKWIDPTHPESKKFLRDIIRSFVDRGYDYIKIDFNSIGSVFYDKKKTRLEAFRDLYRLYREAAGEDKYILSCTGEPERGCVGFVDANRIGPDSWHGGILMAVESVLRFQYLHKIWYAVDADVSYLATKIAGREHEGIIGGDTTLKLWHSLVGLTGGIAMTSDPLGAKDCIQHHRMLEILTPPHHDKARLLDFCTSSKRELFSMSTSREWGRSGVCLLWNSSMDAREVSVALYQLGLETGKTHAVWSFWDSAYHGTTDDTWGSGNLYPTESRLIRVTEIADDDRIPTVVGSDLHISCGAAELGNVEHEEDSTTISLTDAGARDGNLFVLCQSTLDVAGHSGFGNVTCTDAGGGLWKVSITGRKRNERQRITLSTSWIEQSMRWNHGGPCRFSKPWMDSSVGTGPDP